MPLSFIACIAACARLEESDQLPAPSEVVGKVCPSMLILTFERMIFLLTTARSCSAYSLRIAVFPLNIVRVAVSIRLIRTPSGVGSSSRLEGPLLSCGDVTIAVLISVAIILTCVLDPLRFWLAVGLELLLWVLPAPDCDFWVPDAPIGLGGEEGLGVKYSARPLSFALSGVEISHSSMKKAIIAVTKSA